MSSSSTPPGGVPPLPASGALAALSTELPRAGEVLDGRYVLEDPIGEGGVGLIFRATQFKVQRPVAVKFLQREVVGEHQLKPRFEREALALAALTHPNIVRLQDYGVARGHPFLVMEFVEGRTLRGLLNDEGGHLPVLRALALARQLLYALAYAHERGIVHRDLKPANLIVQAFPHQPEHLKILDFGFAKFMPGSDLPLGAQLTRSGHTFGSPSYMSPEHATGGAVDGRSDLYSVGVLLFEMVTGTRPFEGDIQQLLRHHLITPVPRLVERRPELKDPQLQALLDRALAKNRDERFADAAAFLEAMDQLEQQLMAAGGRSALRASVVGLGPWEARGQAAGGFLDRVSRRVQPILERSWHILRVRILPPVAASVKRVLTRRHTRRPPVSPSTRRLLKDVEPTPELAIKSERKAGQPPEIPSDAMVTHDARETLRKR
jgi:eukaryotic-like serine/threonine-protein kinase